MSRKHHLNPFRDRTQLAAISELLLEGKTREQIFRETYPLVATQTDPFIFSDNLNGSRVAKAVYDQIPLLFYAIGRARDSLLKKESRANSYVAPEDTFDTENYNNKRWRAQLFQAVRDEYEMQGGNVSAEPAPIIAEPTIDNSLRGKVEYLYARLCELRQFVQAKKINNREFDYVSTRAFVHGTDAVIAGIDPDDFLVSIGASWSEDTRREAKIRDRVDFQKYAIEGTPLVMGFVLKLIEAKIPVYLYGPTGSGKSVLASMIAEYLEKQYGEIPLSCGVSRTDLYGNWNAKGFVGRPLTEIYGNGGVFCFEEIDAADPNILLAVNNAVANDKLFNSSNGEMISRHSEFVAMATANTLGNGATSNFAAREGLDGSTLDRFKYGRVECDYDPIIERGIVESKLDAAEKVAVAS